MDIKGLLNDTYKYALITDIKIEKYEPVEHIVKDAEGMELYAPEHDYTFECEGIAIGGFESMIEFRRKMDDNPLIEISRMRLQF